MKTLAQHKNGKKNAKRFNAAMAQKQRLAAAEKREPKIPDCVLKALALLGLPRDKALYQKGLVALCELVEQAEAR